MRFTLKLQDPYWAEGTGLEPAHRVNDTGFQDRGDTNYALPFHNVVVNGIEPLSSGPKPDVLAFILNDYVRAVGENRTLISSLED